MESEAIWRREGEQKRSAVRGMFADIAGGYDRMNGLMSFGLHHRWRAFAVARLQLKEGQKVLDVCCGTGDFMLPLRKAVGKSGHVFGVDFCLPMLEGAKQKLPTSDLALGDQLFETSKGNGGGWLTSDPLGSDLGLGKRNLLL